ncbi:MAG: EAL domain-containing protein [Pseudomonadota bacterium]|nr:EAL domain-containing protein [Pseudomonadota bacterium]
MPKTQAIGLLRDARWISPDRSPPATLAGFALLVLGLVTLTGWATQSPQLLQYAPNQVGMVASTAAGCMLAGILLLVGHASRDSGRMRWWGGLALVVLAGIEFAQIIADVQGVLDFPQLHTWLEDGNPHPGRQAPNTSVAWILTGALFLCLSHPERRYAISVFSTAWVLLLLVSLTGFVGYWLSTDLVLPMVHVKMSIPTSIAFALVVIGTRSEWLRWRHPVVSPDKLILRGSGLIFTCMVLVAGISGFAFMQAQARRMVVNALGETLQSRVAGLDAAFLEVQDANAVLATRLSSALREHSNAADGIRTFPLNSELQAALAAGSSYARLQALDGRVIGQAGSKAPNNTAASVSIDNDVWLLWNEQFVVRTKHALTHGDGTQLGVLFAERPLNSSAARHLTDLSSFGSTGETGLCTQVEPERLRCFPQKRNRRMYEISRLSNRGTPLPVTLGLSGKTGTMTGIDYRGQVVMAAYAPAAGGRLGATIKQDTAEIFAPIRNRLLWMLPALAALVALGLYLLRAKIHPLAQQLAMSELTNRITLQSIGDGVICTDTQGFVSYMNPVAERLTGWTSADAAGRPMSEVFHIVNEDTGDPSPSPVDFVLTTGSIGGLALQTTLIARDGTRTAIEDSASAIRDAANGILGVVLVFHDVTQARSIANQMSYQASHDPLTSLINRREFDRRLSEVLVNDGLNDRGHVLLYIDLDQFKIVNDTCGHVAGDELLKQVATILRRSLRNSDDLARLGGDEFGAILTDCPPDSGLRVAEILRKAVMDLRFSWENKPFNIGASIGLVHFNADQSQSELLSNADSACYLAKDEGRNRIHVHHEADEASVRRIGELNWTSRIHAALAEDRFALFAQRIIPVSLDAHLSGHYELLVRMRDEQGELVPPMAFIPAAERYGMMTKIDRWVVRNAFQALGSARASGRLGTQFSINLSGLTMGDATFVDFVVEQFAEFGVPPSQICFEITESAAIGNLTTASQFIAKLKALGCQFSLDDFGTGMSSFAYLKTLQVDFLKIDGGFVRDMVDDEIDAAMVDAINRIGHVMGIKTIAEFVENDEILQRLRDIGVDYAQGFGIHAPAPLDTVLEIARHAKDQG